MKKVILLVMTTILCVCFVKNVEAASKVFDYNNYEKKLTITVDASSLYLTAAWVECERDLDINGNPINNPIVKKYDLTPYDRVDNQDISKGYKYASGEISSAGWSTGHYSCTVRLSRPGNFNQNAKVGIVEDFYVTTSNLDASDCTQYSSQSDCESKGCAWKPNPVTDVNSCHPADYVGWRVSGKFTYDAVEMKMKITALDEYNGIKKLYARCTKDNKYYGEYVFYNGELKKTEITESYSVASFEKGKYHCVAKKVTSVSDRSEIGTIDFELGNCNAFNTETDSVSGEAYSSMYDACVNNGCYWCGPTHASGVCQKTSDCEGTSKEGEKAFKCSGLPERTCKSEMYPSCKWENDQCIIDLSIFGPIEPEKPSCLVIFGSFWKDLKYIGKIFRIVAPILVLILSTYDYVSAVASKDADGLKKANTRMIKRFVLIVFLIFLPTIIEIFLGLLIDGNATTCLD